MATAVFRDSRAAQPRQPGFIRRMWHKYGLIVVGNVVFFALLYVLQYRPNSRDSRATELLSLAQREEAERRFESAEALYTKILADYEGTSAGALAGERLPKVRAAAKKRRETQPPLPAACAPSVDLGELLELKPSFYLTELVAGYYPQVQPAERERYFRMLDDYVWIALNRDRLPLDKLKNNPVFRATELQQRYFQLKANARFAPDWVFDDFKIKNAGFFALTNAVVALEVAQDGSSESAQKRFALLEANAEVELLDFNVRKDGGAVTVKGSIVADQGKVEWQQRL